MIVNIYIIVKVDFIVDFTIIWILNFIITCGFRLRCLGLTLAMFVENSYDVKLDLITTDVNSMGFVIPQRRLTIHVVLIHLIYFESNRMKPFDVKVFF